MLAPETALAPLLKMLSSTDAIDRRIAALSLARLREDAAAAVPALRHALSDTNTGVRAAASYALGQVGQAARLAAAELDARGEQLRRQLAPTTPALEWRGVRSRAGELAVIQVAQRALASAWPPDSAPDPVIDGLRVSDWVLQAEGFWTTLSPDPAGSCEAICALVRGDAAVVLPHVLSGICDFVLLGWGSPPGGGGLNWISLPLSAPLFQLAQRLAVRAPEALHEAAAWAAGHDDMVLLHIVLLLVASGELDRGPYQRILPAVLEAPSIAGFSRMEQPPRELAMLLADGSGPAAEAAVRAYQLRLEGADAWERSTLLLRASGLGVAARPLLPHVRALLDAGDESTLELLDGVPEFVRESVTLRDDLIMAQLRLEHGTQSADVALQSSRTGVRVLGLRELGERQPPDTRDLQSVADALRDSDEIIMEEAVGVFMRAGEEGVLRLRKILDERPRLLGAVLRQADAIFHQDPPGRNPVSVCQVQELPCDAQPVPAGVPNAIRELAAETLRDADPHRRALAARVLARPGGVIPGAANALKALLEDKDAETRAASVLALGYQSNGGEGVTVELLRMLGDSNDERVTAALLCALAAMPNAGPRALPQILETVRRTPRLAPEAAECITTLLERHPDLQDEVVRVLPRLGKRARLDLLSNLRDLTQPSPSLVEAVVACLGMGGRVREAAAVTLAAWVLRDRGGVPELVSVLRQGDDEAKLAATSVLGAVGYPARGGIPALEAIRTAVDSGLSEAAVSALAGIRAE